MANFVDYSCSSSDSGEPDFSGKSQCLDFSYAMINSDTLSAKLDTITSERGSHLHRANFYESMILQHNRLTTLPESLTHFVNIKILNLSGNNLTFIPEMILELKNLTSLIAKNNCLEDSGIPKNLGVCRSLREVNFSGNSLTRFPEQLLELDGLRFLYVGGNQISMIPNTIGRLQRYHQLIIVFAFVL